MRMKGFIAVGLSVWMGLAFHQVHAQAPGPEVATSAAMPAPMASAAEAVAPPPVAAVAAPAAAIPPAPAPLKAPGLVGTDTINGADTAWMMTSTALVLLMTLPGIALFYAGMVRRKSVLSVMACVVATCAIVSLLWFLVGYSIAFTPGSESWGHFIGGTDRMFFAGLDYVKADGKVAVSHIAPNIPESVYSMYQLTFAIITAALVIGAFVERMRFSAMVIFMSIWTVIVYAPIAHWVWEPKGWLARLGALDFAGGSVVHINAGIAGLVCAYVLGPRAGYGREPFTPFNLGLTMAGAGMLWVGWFGFNAGSAVASDGRAGLAMAVTHIAAAAGALSWMGAEWAARGRPSLLGLCSGLVAGLVAITPASGFVSPPSALLIGLIAGVACYWGATGLKRLLNADDSLDVFGVHGVGGIVGCMLTGLLADESISGANGSLLVQFISAGSVMLYSMVMTAVALWLTSRMVSLRVSEADESDGLDLTQHAERLGN